MTRGAKKAYDGPTADAPKSGPKKKKGSIEKTKKTQIKKKHAKTPKVKFLSTSELTPASFRRNVAGRECIKTMMEKLYDLDLKVFAKAPAFDAEGVCRLKFEGSDKFTWSDILESSSKGIEFMFLAKTFTVHVWTWDFI